MKIISILGSGWLGLPLAEHLIKSGHQLKISTTSSQRLALLTQLEAESYVVDIKNLPKNLPSFLQSDILIINIPSKDVPGFANLITQIELSPVQQVMFISSTSVYLENNREISESDGLENEQSPLVAIENMFKSSGYFGTTVVRFGGLIGYGRHPGRFFSKGQKARYPQANVNMIHRDDCINIIDQIIRQNAWGDDYNCCADTHPTKNEFYTFTAKLLGLPAPEFVETDTNVYKIISNKKVKHKLNYRFVHPDLMAIDY